ncbi:MAG: acyl-CoA synthetase FdrA [Deltaproteobacteria bacterium]|nr:acyl-CoA synthetase FdrA [Deltaproteobacteria bacterium]
MSTLKTEIRPGAYFDSIVLMQLQAALAGLEGIEDAGVVMATASNLAVLEANGLLPEEFSGEAEDLVVAVRGSTEAAAEAALGEVDHLLARRSGEEGDEDYRPRSLEQAARQLPEARWVVISIPGRYAARVSRKALESGRNVFLYSDNVSLEEELELKEAARRKGLLVLGPDCGTAHLGGAGFAFANRVQRGKIGLVAASGTGLQSIACRVHELGEGISQAIGTGGRDLSATVGGITAHQAIDLLGRDPQTQVIVLISKPPSPDVCSSLLAAARGTTKPVVVYFLGQTPPNRQLGDLVFATGLEEAAEIAVRRLAETLDPSTAELVVRSPQQDRRWLRALFSGGTLAQEAALGLRFFLAPLASNLGVEGTIPGSDPARSEGHTILDLGADEYTVGRLHPMIDPDLRLRRLRQEASDPEVAALLLDVVLGDGAHPDPAEHLAPVIAEICQQSEIEVLILVVGTDADPQGIGEQCSRFEEAGAQVFRRLSDAVSYAALRLGRQREASPGPPVALADLASPPTVINIGLESFHDSFQAQGATSLQMDWRPPAGGDDRLLGILDKLNRNGRQRD